MSFEVLQFRRFFILKGFRCMLLKKTFNKKGHPYSSAEKGYNYCPVLGKKINKGRIYLKKYEK